MLGAHTPVIKIKIKMQIESLYVLVEIQNNDGDKVVDKEDTGHLDSCGKKRNMRWI